jgi:hypothetical protein
MGNVVRRMGTGTIHIRQHNHAAGSSATPTTRPRSIGAMVDTALLRPCCEAGTSGSRLCPPYSLSVE